MHENDLTGKQLGKYRILQSIGHGGMGNVYKALHPILEKTLCLKVMSVKESENVQYFIDEAKITAMLDHPNIVRFYDIEKDGETYFMVMEYVEGKTVAEILNERDAFPVMETLEIGIQVCEALEYAHRRGVIHRDVKPHNIMVDKEGKAKLTDFGLARHQSISEGTQERNLMGTPEYVAPEYITDRIISPSMDVYAFGLTLFYMLCGESPFKGVDTATILRKHLKQPVPTLRDRRPDIPADLENGIMKMMAKRPEFRIASAAESLKMMELCLSRLKDSRQQETRKYSHPEEVEILEDLEIPKKKEEPRPEKREGNKTELGKTALHNKVERFKKEASRDARFILLVDSNSLTASTLKILFNVLGYRITTALNAADAFSWLEKEKFDLIISEINMPDSDGFQFLRQVQEKGLDIPFMFLTVRNSKADELQALSMGVSDYITKPFKPEILLLRVQNLFKMKGGIPVDSENKFCRL